MAFEDQLATSMFSPHSEKTFIDKVLAKDDVDRIREIIKKPKLKRSELLELLYLISGTESKLLNYSDWDRYVILKFFVWIREFIKVAELLYDYQDDLEKRKKKGTYEISERTKQLIDNNQRLIEHNAKFLIDLYLNIGRTSLSIGATGILEFVRNKFEISYPHMTSLPRTADENKGGILRK